MSTVLQPKTPESRRLDQIQLSIVVPIFNEYPVLLTLYTRLRSVLDPLEINYELVFIDDGSRDGSADYLLHLASTTTVVKAVRLSRNFGKEAAVTAGLEHALGDAVIILDADLQDPPELIPEMLAVFYGGSDVVCMKRRSRAGESWAKRLSAHLFYRLLNRISSIEIPRDTGDFRLMSRRAINALRLLPERNRYMKGLFAWVGFPTFVIEYDREARAAGTTKWNILNLLGLAFEGVTSFSVAPLRWATGMGLVTALVGATFGLWIVVKTLVLGEAVHGYPSLIAMITFMGGIQLLSIGMVGEYVGKTYFEAKQRPLYVILDVVESPAVVRRAASMEKRIHAVPN